MRQIGEGESWYSQVPDPTKRKIITISFSPRSKGSEHHIKIPSLGVLCREDEHPEHLTWNASRAYIRETQRTMRNRDFTLKEHKQNLTCSKIQGRNSNLKEARITLRPKPGWFLFLSAKKEKGRKLETNTLKVSHTYDAVGFVPETQGWFNSHKSISVIHGINKMKNKNHMIISTDAEKCFLQNSKSFYDKILQKVGIEWTYLNTIKAIYDKLTSYSTSYSMV